MAEQWRTPRPIIAWHIGSSTIYALRVNAYEAIARRMIEERYKTGAEAAAARSQKTHERYQRLYCEMVRMTPTMSGQIGQTFSFSRIAEARWQHAIMRLGKFLAFVDSRRSVTESYGAMKAEELTREVQRIEALATSLLERVRALESGK